MRKTVKALTLMLALGSLSVHVNSECQDFCYIKDSANGKCTICYNECTDSTQTTFLSCSIATGEDSEQQQLGEDMCKGICYPEEYPELTEKLPILQTTLQATIQQQIDQQQQQQEEQQIEDNPIQDSQPEQTQQQMPSVESVEQNVVTETQPSDEVTENEDENLRNQPNGDQDDEEENVVTEDNEEPQAQEDENQPLVGDDVPMDEEGFFNSEEENQISKTENELQDQEPEEVNVENGEIQEKQQKQQLQQEQQQQQEPQQESQPEQESQQELQPQQNQVTPQQNLREQPEEPVINTQSQIINTEEQFIGTEEQQAVSQQVSSNTQQEDLNYEDNDLIIPQEDPHSESEDIEPSSGSQPIEQQPITAFVQQENPSQGPQVPLSYEQLKKLKKQRENWKAPTQNLIQIFLVLVSSSVLFIIVFTQIYKCFERRRHLKQIQLQQKKEWSKTFQKLSNSDTTICTNSSRESQVVALEQQEKAPQSAQTTN